MSIQMVAEHAGVAPTTVARVINNQRLVAKETVERVLAAMRELNYTPPAPAKRRGPRTEQNQGLRTRNIAHLVVGMDASQMRSVITPGILAESLSNHGLNLIFIPMPDPAKLPPIIDLKHVDGVIIQGVEPSGKAAQALKSIPTVWMMTRRSETFWADYVQPDNEANGRMAAEFLIDQGHRNLGIINLQPNYPAFQIRTESFVKYAKLQGASVHEPAARLTDTSSVLQTGRKLIQEWVEGQVIDLCKASPRPTGVFLFAAQEIASLELLAIYIAFQRRGLQIGKEVSIVSSDFSPEWLTMDNLISGCIDIQMPLIAERAVEHLIWRIKNPNATSPVGVSIPPKLIVPTK